jgi:hypothetical protein
MTNSTNYINEAVYNSQRFSDGPESGNDGSRAAGSFLSVLEKHQAKFNDALAEWLDLASQMDPDPNGKTMIESRLSYPFYNEAQQSYIALYGNRTEEEVQTGQKMEIANNRYSARENLAYRENRWDAIKDEEDGMNGPSYAKSSAYTYLMEARLNFGMMQAKHALNVAMYELLNGIPFVYKPYEEKVKVRTTGSANAKLGASLMVRSQLTNGVYAGQDPRAA